MNYNINTNVSDVEEKLLLESSIYFVKDNKIEFDNICTKLNIPNYIYANLIFNQITSKTSSDLREKITVIISGAVPKNSEDKLGQDGSKNGFPVEAKCINNKCFENRFHINDCSQEMIDKYSRENYIFVLSGFDGGRLVYIISFNVNENKFFLDRLQEEFDKQEKSMKLGKRSRKIVGFDLSKITKAQCHYRHINDEFLYQNSPKEIKPFLSVPFSDSYTTIEVPPRKTESIDDLFC